MCCSGLLPIGRPLHRSKHLLDIAPQKPASSPGPLGQAFSLQHGEACCFVLSAKARHFAQSDLRGIPHDSEVLAVRKWALGFDAFRIILRSSDVNLVSLISRRSASIA
jgi:hypothetical protein